MKTLHALCVAPVVALAFAGAAMADETITGAIRSAAGLKLEGVTVSAKREGSTITTAVYTDKVGRYVFPPLPEGQYRVWAQAPGFETARASVQNTAKASQDLALQPITDPEKAFHQLPSEALVAALPDGTPHDAFMKKIFMNNCTSCHSPSLTLHFRFDEDGWKKIIALMKTVPVTGVYPGPDAKPNQVINRYEDQLAAYLARARGPGESSMKLVTPKRPTGEATRAVWTLYDLPWNEESGLGGKAARDAGDDWSLGTYSKLGQMPHDGGMGLDGTIYFTSITANTRVSIGKLDPKTGDLKMIKVDGAKGAAAGTHGFARDAQGNFWFDVNPGRRSLGKLDVKTEQITVYPTPASMSPLGGAVTVDIDGKNRVWASTPDGVVRFDPASEKFTEFKSLLPGRAPRGNGATYGVFADKDGNGLWAQMAMDIVYRADATTGEVTPIKIPDAKTPPLPPEERRFFETVSDATFSAPLFWSPGPRRGAVDKERGILWVGNSWGSSLDRIETKTGKVTVVPMPEPTMQAYHAAIDSKHRVWANLWTSDRLVRYDPDHKSWTVFPLPVRGTEVRHISLHEADGKTYLVMPVYRTNQMSVLRVRDAKEIASR